MLVKGPLIRTRPRLAGISKGFASIYKKFQPVRIPFQSKNIKYTRKNRGRCRVLRIIFLILQIHVSAVYRLINLFIESEMLRNIILDTVRLISIRAVTLHYPNGGP